MAAKGTLPKWSNQSQVSFSIFLSAHSEPTIDNCLNIYIQQRYIDACIIQN